MFPFAKEADMWCTKMLVAYDGSTPSHKALEVARDIATHDAGIEVLLVYVTRLYASGTAAAGIDTVLFDDMESIRAELEDIAATLPNQATVKMLTGTSPADLIVRCAVEENCDLIVMGSRGKGGVKGYLGSVSYAVTKGSPITVLIAKEESAR